MAPRHVTGGSSGGPGVAVAAGLCYASLGTDTAGSIRMPASHCGIVGLKPTYGRVSTRGVMTLSWTLDHVGPMCRTVEDAALLLNVVAGYDAADPTTANVPVEDYTRALGAPTARLRVGLPQAAFFDDLDADVGEAVQEALGVLEGLTATRPPVGVDGGERHRVDLGDVRGGRRVEPRSELTDRIGVDVGRVERRASVIGAQRSGVHAEFYRGANNRSPLR